MGDHTKGTGVSKYKSSSVDVGGKTVTIKNQLDKYAGKEKQLVKAKTDALATDETISSLIKMAKKACHNAIVTFTGTENITSRAIAEISRCFCIKDRSMTYDERKTARKIYAATYEGLNKNITIKFSDMPSGNASQNGGVRWYDSNKLDEMTKEKRETLIVHNLKAYSNIKISQRYFNENIESNPRLVIKTLIHEATHRFANTDDYCYMTKDGSVFDGNPPSPEQCLDNADSFAWFAMHILD